ncbi:membrane fusion protein (multidrug efflux system) [Rahnella sp. BIGb0236]|uniref:efflux RND transporter periplasmic adaptor subunit n=1 Tax=Rahnella sp. BIGb0236 TaxID=2485117 RepID=UPI0010610614|nr:efflux RND transporter periplasmic adaptor subunit [Rahnella sp. BIGb0236]TDS98191.1 membrane fusion protein (multidrug efflux system) [Rahnella sp. BIGb0236]
MPLLRPSCLIMLFALSGCDNSPTAPPAAAPTEVGVVTLKAQPFNLVSELTGRTTATLTADVRPQVGGIIQKRLFTEGDTVKAGQALYQIDPSSYKATYDQAAAALKSANALVLSDCQKARRYAVLVKEQGVSQQDAEDAQSACAEDRASVDEKVAALEAAKINLDWTRVTSPIAGRIGISSVTPGALVSAAQDTALATVRNLDSMYVDLTRSSADLLSLRKRAVAANSEALGVTLTLEDGSVYPEKGRLELTEVAVDEATGSVTLRAVFPNPKHVLLPGMFIRADVDEGVIENAILAPQQGITRDAKGDATALVVTAAGKVEQRDVETGEATGTNWLIVKGLQAGDRVLVEGNDKVTVGDTVKAIEVKNTATNSTEGAA